MFFETNISKKTAQDDFKPRFIMILKRKLKQIACQV
jgi:hypothetical protein